MIFLANNITVKRQGYMGYVVKVTNNSNYYLNNIDLDIYDETGNMLYEIYPHISLRPHTLTKAKCHVIDDSKSDAVKIKFTASDTFNPKQQDVITDQSLADIIYAADVKIKLVNKESNYSKGNHNFTYSIKNNTDKDLYIQGDDVEIFTHTSYDVNDIMSSMTSASFENVLVEANTTEEITGTYKCLEGGCTTPGMFIFTGAVVGSCEA